MRGRRPAGPEYVEQLNASGEAKQRLRAVLETLAGRLRVHEACAQLGIGPVRFHALRHSVLQAALAALEPRPAGRPPHDAAAATAADEDARLQELATQLEAAQLREEVTLILATPNADAEKKTRRHRPRPTRPSKRRTSNG